MKRKISKNISKSIIRIAISLQQIQLKAHFNISKHPRSFYNFYL